MTQNNGNNSNNANSFENVKNTIKSRMPLATVLERDGYQLVHLHSDESKVLCPFHEENTPSCFIPSVDSEVQSAHCFGCGVTFDIFDYYQRKHGLDFKSAMVELADELHISLKGSFSGSSIPRSTLKKAVLDASKILHLLYSKLPSEHLAVKESTKRRLNLAEMACFPLIGWSPENNREIIRVLQEKGGYSDEILLAAGIAIRSKYHNNELVFPWKNRLMFTICDLMGNPIGFVGRRIFEEDANQGKYVNSRDNELYHKREILYNLHLAKNEAREKQLIYVVEGQFDVLACVADGFANTVAASGTAFTIEQAHILQRTVTPDGRIVFMFDNDEAGKKAALRTFKILSNVQSQAYAVIPTDTDKDASDMYRDTPELLRETLSKIKPLYAQCIDNILSTVKIENEHELHNGINACLELAKTIVDPIVKDNFLTYLSLHTGISKQNLELSQDSSQKQPQKTGFNVTNSENLPIEAYILALTAANPQLKPKLAEIKLNEHFTPIQQQILSENPILSDDVNNMLNLATARMMQPAYISGITVDINVLFDQQASALRDYYKQLELQEFRAKQLSQINSNTNIEVAQAALDKYNEILSRHAEETAK